MAFKGQTGTSMGGRVVRRKDLRPAKEKPPVDPATLTAEALARREAYRREQQEREAAAAARAEAARAARVAAAGRDAAAGKRAVNAGDALRRRR